MSFVQMVDALAKRLQQEADRHQEEPEQLCAIGLALEPGHFSAGYRTLSGELRRSCLHAHKAARAARKCANSHLKRGLLGSRVDRKLVKFIEY